MIDAGAAIARLRELDARSGGARVAWSETWARERERFAATAQELVPAIEVEQDPFANRWLVVPGERRETILLGGHSDCVPGGGWLDGILGLHAGLEVMRALCADGRPRRTLALVDWADEEGARFGRSLLGSSAACGELTAAVLDALRDADGVAAPAALAPHGFARERLGERSERLADVVAAVELHIEQGPVLERDGRACSAVSGCLGVRRSRVELRGEAGHAGATPMADRRDPVRAAARLVADVADAAEAAGGLATVGRIAADPAIPTAVAARCELTLDLRHGDRDGLAALERAALDAARRAAERHRCELDQTPLWEIEPIAFDGALVERAVAASDGGPALLSGPLHDGAALARAGIPTTMLFAPSIGGVSHARAEDTREQDLAEAIAALHRFAAGLVALP